MYNVDQQLFSYCTAKFSDSTQCCVPVFDVTHELPLCHEHSTKVVSVLSLTPSNCCTWIIQILCNSISEMPLKKLEKYDITKSLDALLRSTPLGMKHMQFCVGVVTSEVIPDPCAGWMMYSVQTSHISNHPQRITTFGPPGDCPRLRFDSFDSCARYKFSSFIHSFKVWGCRYVCCSFYPRDAMLARVIVIATCLSVRLSVCLSVRHAPVLCQNEESYRHDFFTIW